MALKNWVPCYLRRDMENPKFVKVLKDTIRYSHENKSLVVLDVATGFGRFTNKVPKRSTEPVPVPAERVALMGTNGVENGLRYTDGVAFVCTDRNVCHKKLLDEFNKLNGEKEGLNNRIQRIKEKIDEYVRKVKEDKGEIPLLWSQLQEDIRDA